jgi:hypothetical protein
MPSVTLAQLARGEHLRRTMRVYRFLGDGVVVVDSWLIGPLIRRYGYELPSWITRAVWGAGTFRRWRWGLE